MTALARIREEGRPLIQAAAKRWQPKVIERELGIPAKTLEKHRQGVQPGWDYFVALCKQDPELRSWAMQQWNEEEDPQKMLLSLVTLLKRRKK